MTHEVFAGTLLENEELFHGLIQCVQNAGEIAAITNHICVLPMESAGITRRVRPIDIDVKDVPPIVKFDKRSITLVGGGAIQAYNFTLRDRLGFEYTNPTKKTPDLDFVWWPTIDLPKNISDLIKDKTHGTPLDTSKYAWFDKDPGFVDSEKPFDSDQFAVVSSSPVIQEVIHQFEQNLANQLEEFVKSYGDQILAIASKVYKSDDVSVGIQSDIKNVFFAGVCNVFGSLILSVGGTEHVIQIIEMTIHDGASSQVLTTLKNAIQDPIFSIYSSSPMGIVSNITLYHNSKLYTVPVLDRLMEQQFFALQNQYVNYYPLPEKIKKIESHFRRCHYIYYGILGKYRTGNELKDVASRPIFSEPAKLLEYYSTLFENTENWIRSCVLPSVEICGFSRENKIFKELCKAGKMMKMELCKEQPQPQMLPQPPQPPQMLPQPPQPSQPPQMAQIPPQMAQIPPQMAKTPHQTRALNSYHRAYEVYTYHHKEAAKAYREMQSAQQTQAYHEDQAAHAYHKVSSLRKPHEINQIAQQALIFHEDQASQAAHQVQAAQQAYAHHHAMMVQASQQAEAAKQEYYQPGAHSLLGSHPGQYKYSGGSRKRGKKSRKQTCELRLCRNHAMSDASASLAIASHSQYVATRKSGRKNSKHIKSTRSRRR